MPGPSPAWSQSGTRSRRSCCGGRDATGGGHPPHQGGVDMTTTSTDRRSRDGMGRWALTVGGFAVASVAIGTVLLASRWSQIPAIVATHWGPGGGVDATMSRSRFVLTTALFLLGLTAFFGLLAWMESYGRRILAATAGGTAAL